MHSLFTFWATCPFLRPPRFWSSALWADSLDIPNLSGFALVVVVVVVIVVILVVVFCYVVVVALISFKIIIVIHLEMTKKVSLFCSL